MKLTKNIPTIDLISCLFTATAQIHIFHLQVVGEGSYATHNALNKLYDDIPDYIDGLVETIQGKKQAILKGYKLGVVEDFKSSSQVIEYNNKLISELNTYRSQLPFEWDNIDNQIQTLIDLLESTNYKLKFLK